MPTPLRPEDPGGLGPFRLESRLHESPAGIVYLGADPYGRKVSVALLTTSAAGDAAARDRFRAAIEAETPPPDSVPRRPEAPGPDRPAPVVAALAEGEAPWVATAYQEGRPGAERFLEPVLLRWGWGIRGRRRGPNFQPYWADGPVRPALRPAVAAARTSPAVRDDARGLATAALSLAALLALLGLLVVLLFSCRPTEPVAPPPTETATVATSPQPSPSTARPTPTPRRSASSPRPSRSDGRDTANPASAAGSGRR